MPQVETVVVGTKFRGGDACETLARMRPGDSVRLVREPENKHDLNAIQCHYLGVFVGYVSRYANEKPARAFDEGLEPIATCTARADVRGTFIKIEPKITISWEAPT